MEKVCWPAVSSIASNAFASSLAETNEGQVSAEMHGDPCVGNYTSSTRNRDRLHTYSRPEHLSGSHIEFSSLTVSAPG